MNTPKGHPKGLYLIFATSMSERFSYYGMRAIFTLFLIKALLMDKELASAIYGNYTGLVYLTPLLGGYIADRYWGIRHSVFRGAVMMAIGQFLMFASASMLKIPETAHWVMYAGLGFIIFGNGFFKPTVATLVGQLYEPNDKRLDAAYTLFYMGVNVGAFLAPLVCGFLGDTGNPADFRWGFLAASIVMILSVLLFETQKDKYLVSYEGKPIGMKPVKAEKKKEKIPLSFRKIAMWGIAEILLFSLFMWIFNGDTVSAGIFSCCIAIPGYVLSDGSLAKPERDKIIVIYIIAFFVVFFWSAYEQAGASLTYFADEQTDRSLFGWEMPASYFQSFNPIFVVILAYLMPMVWSFMSKRGINTSSPVKQAIGLLLLSLGYLFIAFGVHGIEPGVKVSIMWLTGLYFIHTMGEIWLSPIGLSMVNKLTPVRFASLMMGIWYMSNAAANKFAGTLSGLYPEAGKAKYFLGFRIENLYDFFMLFVFMSGAASIILFCLSKKLQKMMHEVE